MPPIVEQKHGYKIVTRRGQSTAAGLVDQHGRALKRRGAQPTASWGMYPTPRYAGQDNYRPRPFYAQTSREVISDFDRLELVQYSKQLFTQLGNLGSAITQKNAWAVGDGWDVQYYGQNAAWGAEVEAWLKEQFYPMCDVRGAIYDFKTNLYLSGIAWDVEGDDLMILTESESGFPQVRFESGERIAGSADEIKSGPFQGARLTDGVIFNRDGRAIGYRIQGDDNDDFTDISAFNAQMLYEPEWHRQGRGIPRVGRGILDFFDIQDIDFYLKQGVKLDASEGLSIYNELGEAEDGTETVSGSELQVAGSLSGDTRKDAVIPTRDIQLAPISGPGYRYFKANSGEKIESLKSERPHPNTEAFIERIERRGLQCVGWFYELLDPSNISGAPVRLIQDLAQQSIATRQKTLRLRARRAIGYAVCKGMKNKIIPENYADDGDFLKWAFTTPAEISVDTGNDEQADRENMKIGTTSMAAVCGKKGRWWKDVRRQTKIEIVNLDEEAQDIVKQTSGRISYEKALDFLSKRDPNSAAAVQQAEDNAPAPSKTAPPTKAKK